MRLLATVSGGRLELTGLSAFEGRRVRVTVEPDQGRRSNQANRRYFKVIVRPIMDFFNRGRELPLSKEQVHYLLAGAFVGHIETPLGLIPKETHTLDTHEFYDYTEKVRAHFSAEYGLEFHDSDEHFDDE